MTPWRDYGRIGFRLRRNRCGLRAAGGSWLRNRMKVRGGLIAQAKHLLEMLRQFSALVGALARRRRSGLTRLNPLVLTHAPHLRGAASDDVAPALADSS